MRSSAGQLEIYWSSSVCRLNEKKYNVTTMAFCWKQATNNKVKFEVTISHLGNTVISMDIPRSISNDWLPTVNFMMLISRLRIKGLQV